MTLFQLFIKEKGRPTSVRTNHGNSRWQIPLTFPTHARAKRYTLFLNFSVNCSENLKRRMEKLALTYMTLKFNGNFDCQFWRNFLENSISNFSWNLIPNPRFLKKKIILKKSHQRSKYKGSSPKNTKKNMTNYSNFSQFCHLNL